MNFDLTYTLKKSPRRRTYAAQLTLDGEWIVYAPAKAKDTDIRAFIDRHRAWFQKRIAAAETKKDASLNAASEKETARLGQEARRYLPERIRYYEELTGLHATGFRVTAAKTRFGSCNAKNALSFSCYLMLYPKECIDYVVLHEIAHIRYKDHSKDFHALIGTYMPDHRERRQRLKKI